VRQEPSDLAQLRDPSREILLSAVTTIEQTESTIRVHRRLSCQLNCHTETNRLGCRCSTEADNGSQRRLPITPWQTRQPVHQADGNQLQLMPDARNPALLDCWSSAQSIANYTSRPAHPSCFTSTSHPPNHHPHPNHHQPTDKQRGSQFPTPIFRATSQPEICTTGRG